MLMTLCETGTRGLIGAFFGPASKGEPDYAHDPVGHLTSDMLLLADRAFDSNRLLVDIAAQGAQFLIRATTVRRPPVLALLPDGSYLTRIGDLSLRVIEAEVRSRTADGGAFGGTYRLLTTLTDPSSDPPTTWCISTTSVGRSRSHTWRSVTPCSRGESCVRRTR
ncbi:hypothetical protein [Streptomyces sp. NPDC005476]|uniref:hypothetical protein n=1 Tax=Streptomyces sp. NPDC005476 TaxID=3156882 RepID=UPI0034554513